MTKKAVTILLAGVLAGCAFFSSSGRMIHQQGRTVIQLERDQSAAGVSASRGNAHPASIQTAQMASLLRGIQIRSEQGIVGTLLSLTAPAESVFMDEEVTALAPLLADGLAQAAPSERVGFTYWSAQAGRRNRPLSGSIAIRGPYLRFGLNEHPTVGWQDPQDSSAPTLYELEFAQPGALAPGTEDERKAGRTTRPVMQINYRQYLAATSEPSSRTAPLDKSLPTAPLGTGSGPIPQPPVQQDQSVSDNATLNDLRRQVHDLTVSNQELRATITDLSADQDQVHTLQALHEELVRLRRELAETKQLLADKALELHRLQGRSKEIK